MRKAAGSVWDSPWTLALWPASTLYAFGWNCYAATYSLGLRKRYRSKLPTVCIGNLTVGGTGKTPLTMFVHRVILGMGHKVVISVSGYGSAHFMVPAVAPPGDLNPAVWGDEAALIRWKLPETPLVVGKKRAAAARLAEDAFPEHVLLMDDGFQHLALEPSVSIILDPVASNRFCLPAGPYREPRARGLKRASTVVPGRFQLRSGGLEVAGGVPTEADLLCAVGSPGRVESSVEDAGVNLVQRRIEADHDPLDRDGLLDGLGEVRPLIVTSKDWVKLKNRRDLGGKTVLVADYQASLEPEEEFATWLKEQLFERMDTPSH